MGNKLRDMITKKEKKIGTIIFNDQMSCSNFIEKLEEALSTGEYRETNGIKSIKNSLKEGNSNYPINKFENIDKAYIAPVTEITFPVDVDGDVKKIKLNRINFEDIVQLYSQNDDIIEIRISMIKKQHEIKFHFNIHPEKAQDLEILLVEHKKLLAFIKKLLKVKSDSYDNDDNLNNLEKDMSFLLKLIDLEKVLNISISPKFICDKIDDELLLEKLYTMFVKNKKIRCNDKVNSMGHIDVLEDEFGEGKTVLLNYMDTIDYNFFGQKITIYTVNFIFNAIIDKISEDSDGKKKVYFTDTDLKPMYRSYAGFLKKEDADLEMKNIKSKIEEYKNAKNLN